jgi:RNA polymerase sigma-70 factor (ECF subfamily)
MADSPLRVLQAPASAADLLATGSLKDAHIRHAARIDHLFREHNDALLRFLTARLGSYQDASEVAQEAYVRLLGLDRPGAVSFLKALLYKTASNLAIDRLRHRRLVVRHERNAAGAAELFESPADAASVALDDVRVIATALRELPARCRSAFLMSRVEALDSAEIAARLGVTDRAVRKYIARSLVFLRMRLQHAQTPHERRSVMPDQDVPRDD